MTSRHGLVAVQARSFGSGHWIGPDVVITAAHVVVERGVVAPWIELGGSDYRTSGSVLWFDEDYDVALLAVADGGGPAAVRFGSFGSVSGAMAATVRGYPQAEVSATRSGVHWADGTVSPGTEPGRGRLAFSVSTAAPRDHPPGPRPSSPWQGMSGAAICCGPYLVAVVVGDPTRWTSARLDACRIDQLPPGFAATLAERGIALDLTTLRLGPAGWATVDGLDQFEAALATDLASAGHAALRHLGDALGLPDLPADDEAAAGILARELWRNLSHGLPLAVDLLANVHREIAHRLHLHLGPFVWIDRTACTSLHGYIDDEARARRTVVVPSRRVEVGNACIRAAGGVYRHLPSWWRLAEASPEVDFVDADGWMAAIEAAIFSATGEDRHSLADLFGLSPAEIGVEHVLAEHEDDVIVLLLPRSVDDALLSQLRSAFDSIVFVTLEQAEERVRRLCNDGCTTVVPSFDPTAATAYARRARRLSPSA